MAVYTDVSDEELEDFIASYAVGALTSFKGIAEGVETPTISSIPKAGATS